MCDCIETINADLKPRGHALNATMFGVRRVLIDLIRTDTWRREQRRSVPNYHLATFCPFCGERYAEKPETKRLVVSQGIAPQDAASPG